MGLLEKLQAMQGDEETPEESSSIEQQLQDINPPEPDSDGKEPCPYCNKRFIHLAKHVCKEKKKTPETVGFCTKCGKSNPLNEDNLCVMCEEDSAVVEPEPAVKVKWEFKKDETVIAVLPVKIMQQWGSDEDQRYHVSYQPSVGTREGAQTPAIFDVKAEQLSSMNLQKKQRTSAATIANKTEEEISTGFTLMLDAIFERNNDSNIIEFSEFIKNFCDAVAKENQVEYWSVIEFGKSPGFLASKLERWLTEHLSELNGHTMTASTDTLEFRAVKEVLKRNAVNIIQGVR